MDLWATEHLGTPYDSDGAFAARGQVQNGLLQALLSEPYLARPAPKSTGRELFHRAWLEPKLRAMPRIRRRRPGHAVRIHGGNHCPGAHHSAGLRAARTAGVRWRRIQ